MALNNQSDADFAGLMDYLSEIYYYFDGSSDSYINQLVDNLDNMTTADQVAMTEFGDGADTSVGDVFQKTANVFSTQFMMVASGNGAASVGFENTQMATYSMPSGMNTQFWSGIYSEFINNIVSTYISEIVPGAESYVLEKILPAVNTASDTQGMQDTSSTGILNNIDENSNELVHALMTIDGAYSLSTIVTHIESMYENLGDSLGSLLSAMMSLVGINSNDTLGEYVGATEPGTTTGWNDTTLSGNAIAFPNFSMFNQIYLAYSKAIVSAAYGYAMVGKYDAIQTMYSESASDPDAVWTALGITDNTTPSQIDVSKFNVSIPASDTVMTETFQQGVWDVYHYIKPFYDQGVADAATDSTITSTTTLDDPTYLNEVWNEVGGNNLTDTNGDKLTTTYTGTDTTDTNPHDVANYVSPQTQAYLVSFYAEVVSSNELAYSEQPAIETIVKDASGSVVKTNYTAIGSAITTTSTGADLTGSFGDAIDLPTTINGYTKPTDASSITIPESGGVVYVPYSVVTVNAGQVTVKSVGAPSTATFDYTVTNSNGQVVNGATGVSYGAGVEVDLTDGDTLNVTPATVDGYVDSVSPASSVSYDDTVNAINTVTVTYGQQVSYTIQPTDANGVNIGTATAAITGVSGAPIDTTQLPTVAGYTAPTFNDTDTDTTNNTPVISAAGGVIKVAYTANEQTFTVTQTGEPAGNTTGYSYTVNGGTAQTGAYGTAVTAHVGDAIAITPGTITNYDASVNNGTITLGASAAGSAAVTYSQTVQTFTVSQTGAPTGSTAGYTYTVNGGTAQTGTYGTAVSAHAGDKIVVTPTAITNYNASINNNTITLAADKASSAAVTYTQIAQTFTVTQTGAPTGSTAGFTYTVNGGTAQNGTYGTAVSAHAGDTIAITAGTITNYKSAINNGTLTLSATATGTATVTYTLATQTVAMALSQAVVANYDGTTTASGFLTTGVTKYSDATNATTGSLSWLAWNNTAISTYFAGAGASQKTAFVNDLAAMGTSANLSKYFTLANDGTTSDQYSYTLTQAGIDAINSALATTTGGLYQVSFASGAATSQVVIENQLSFVPISKVYDGTSVTSVAPQLTIEGKYYDTKNNVLTGYKTITGQTGVSDFTPISGDQNVGTYIEKLNADGVAWLNTTFASYIKGDVNGANFSYMTAEMTVTARAATVTPVITAVAKDGTPAVSLSFNVPAVTGAANIASGSSLAPSYKFSDLTKGSDYTLTDVNDLMTVTLSDAGLTKIGQANPNYSFTSVAGTAATSTITFNYIDTQNGNTTVHTATQTGLASDNSAQNYAVDLFGWPTGTEYQLGPTQVSSIPYTFGTSKSVDIYLTHYTATVTVTVTDTNGNTLTAPQTINLDPLDSNTSTADVAVNGYPTSQIKSITYTYVTGGRNDENVSNVVATVNDEKTSVSAVQNMNDGTTDTVKPATNGNGSMLADMFGNGMLITFGSPVTIKKSDQSDLLQYASIAVVYFAQATATVDFVDDDDKDADGNSTALTDTQTISGFVDDPAQNTPIAIPTGYALATTQDSNVTVTDGAAAYTGVLTDDDSDNAVVHLVHATETIDPDNTTVGTADYNATHVTVNVNVVAGDNPTAVQITNGNESAVYTRSAIKDDVTGTYTYAANTNWKLAGPILGTPTVKAASGYAVTYTGEGTTNGTLGNGGQLMNITALDVPNALKTATPGETISLNYTVNAESTSQTIKVNYVDTTDGADKVVATDTTTGTPDETISYDATTKIPAGYTLANGQASTVTYAVTDQTDQVISVNLVHKIITVNANKPYAQGTLIDTSNPTGATYPDGVANADLNRILMRTITYSYAGSQDSINTIGQGALFTRTATVDEVTGTLLGYSDWEVSTSPTAPIDYANGSFNGYETPTIKGYTPNIADVPALAVTSDVIANYTDGSLDVNVVYTADPTITVDPTDPKNAGDQIDSNNPDGLNYPEGVDETSLNKSISRLITYTGVISGNPASVSQTGNYTRTATIDEKTGELLGYGDWTLTTSDDGNDTNDGFTAVASPEVLGYTASGDAPATAPTNDEITNFVAHSADVSVTYSQDATITIDPTNPQNPGTLIDQSNPDGPKYPDGVSDSELNKSVSRTINYSGAEPNNPTSVTQTGYYTRTATIDAKTGDFLSYGDWTLTTTDDDNNTNDGFTAVTSPAVKGYTASSDVAAATLSNDEISSFVAGSDDVAITYAQDATITIDPTDPKNAGDPIDASNPDGLKYPEGVDQTDLNKQISRTITYTGAEPNDPASVKQTGDYTRTATIDAKTGDFLSYGDWTLTTSDDDNDTNDGFTAVTSPKVVGYTSSGDAEAVSLTNDDISNFVDKSADVAIIYSQDATITIDPTDPKNLGDPIDSSNPDGAKYPDGVSATALNKSISRTITYENAGTDTPAQVVQTGNYTRTATIDAKTGDFLSYGDWTLATSDDDNATNDGFTAVTSPKVLGYTASGNAAAVTPTNDEINSFVAGSADVKITYSANDTATVTTPINTGDPVSPDGPASNKTITDADLNKTVSRAIDASFVGGTKDGDTTTLANQSTAYTRSAIFDSTTGEFLTFTDWTVAGTDGLTAYTPSAETDYTVTPTTVVAVSASDLTTALGQSDATIALTPVQVVYTYAGSTTTDPDGGTTTTTTDDNGNIVGIDKTWPDGDQTHITVDTDTNVATATETPNGQMALTPVSIDAGETTTTGKTTVTNGEPNSITLTHDTTPTDTDGNPTSGPSSTSETILPDGTVAYFKSDTGDAVSVASSNYYVTTTTNDPDGGTTATTTNGNDKVTNIEKTWPDGDQTQVAINTETNVITTTETPNGQEPLTPVIINQGDTATTGKTTVTNNEPTGGVTLSHDTTGTDAEGHPTAPTTIGETVTPTGSVSYDNSAVGDAVSVNSSDYYVTTTTTDPDGGTTATTVNGNGDVTQINKTWADGDQTQVSITPDDTEPSTSVVTTAETPNGGEPVGPVSVPTDTAVTTGKTTVTNSEPDGVTLSHTTTGTDADGNPVTVTTSETVTAQGELSYAKSASAAPVNVDPDGYFASTTTDDPNGGTTVTTTNGNGQVTKIDKTWPDGDETQVAVNTSTNVVTTTETPSVQEPLAPVTISPNDTATTGKTTVTNNEPDGVTLSHDTTGTDADGNPTSATTGETVTSTGTTSYTKSASAAPVSVDPSDYSVTTTTDDPNGGTTTTTDGNDKVTKINKTWPDGDKTQVDIDTSNNEITTTETPSGQDPLAPVTTKPGETSTTGKTTVTNDEPDGVTLSHDTTGTDSAGNPTAPSTTGETVTPTGTVSYFKTAVGDAISVDPSDYFVTGEPVTDPDGGTTTTTKDGNGNVVKIDKTWPDSDQTQVDVDTDTNEITTTETPNGQDPMTPVTTQPGKTTTTGKTTVTNNEPNGGVTLSHDITGSDTEGNPTAPSTTGETVTPTGAISYLKTAVGDAVSVDPSNYFVTGQPVTDPDGGTTTTTKDGNGNVVKIDKTWSDGDQTQVDIDTSTNEITKTETPNGQDPMTPVTTHPGKTTTTGKTTVTNNEPNGGVTLSHDITGSDTEGNPTAPSTTGETVTPTGAISYLKTAVGDAVSVDPSNYFVTGQPVTDPDGGTTTTTKDGNGNVVKIDKTWSDGDQTQVDVDTSTNEITTTETPSGQDPLTPVTTQPNETTTTGKTTVTNNEPTGVTLSHDTTGTNSDGNPTAPSTTGETVTPTGTITYTKTANADPVSVDPSDYYVTTTTDDPNGGTTTLTTNGNGEVTTIDKTWPNGDQTHVAIDQNGTATATETPSGQPSLTPITVQPGETSQTGETVTSDGTISYTKSDVPTPPSVSASDYYDNTTGSGNSGTNAGTENNTTGTTGETGTTGTVTGTGSSSETGTDVSTTNSGAHSNTVKTTTIGQGANTIATNSNSTEAGVNNISTAQAASQSVATTNKSLDQPTHTADQTGKQNLPQTSESTNQAGVLGLLGAILGIFGLAGTRRKKHEDN